MSKRIERDVSCGICDETFRGSARGIHGIDLAFEEAGRMLLTHSCNPTTESPGRAGIPRVSRDKWRAIMAAVERAMRDVTITSHKV